MAIREITNSDDGSVDRGEECKIPDPSHDAIQPPWVGGARERERTAIARYVAERACGVSPATVARDVLDESTGSAGYHRVRRFLRGCSWFRSTEIGGVTVFSPADSRLPGWADGLNLYSTHRGLQNHPTATGEGCKTSKLGEETGADVDDSVVVAPEGARRTPKAESSAFLSKVSQLKATSTRRSLWRSLGQYLRDVENMGTVLRRLPGESSVLPEYLAIEYEVTQNTPSLADRRRGRYESAWDVATSRFGLAVLATLTSDPKLHDSIADAGGALMDSLNNLNALLANEVDGRAQPDAYLWTVEVTRNGVLHLHVVYFGVPWLMHQAELSRKWSDYGQGSIVYLQSLRNRDGSWRYAGRRTAVDVDGAELERDDLPAGPWERPTSPRDYLSKVLRAGQGLARRSASDLTGFNPLGGDVDRSEWFGASGHDVWSLAVLWALGKRPFGASTSLKPWLSEGGGDVEEHRPRYEYIGTFDLSRLPAHMTRDIRYSRRGDTRKLKPSRSAREIDGPPPPGATSSAT